MEDTDFTPEGQVARHARNYHSFMLGVKWFGIHLAALVVFLVLSFATSAGIGWGIVGGVVVAAIGVYAMNHGLAHSSEGESLPQA